MVSMEQWKPTDIFPDLYEVSNLGRVRRIKRDGRKVLVAPKKNNGYSHFCLWSGGKPHWRLAHRLAWEAFIGPIPERMQINHKNGDKGDNSLDNLEVVTASENVLHKFRVLRAKPTGVPNYGERNGAAKLTAEIVANIRARLDRGETGKDLAAEFGVTPTLVSHIKLGKVWRHI